MPAQLQNLLTQQFPDNFVPWGGQNTSSASLQRYWLTAVPSLILDLNGIQFAVQTVLLLMIGPYADYGTWRPWLLICESACPKPTDDQSSRSSLGVSASDGMSSL